MGGLASVPGVEGIDLLRWIVPPSFYSNADIKIYKKTGSFILINRLCNYIIFKGAFSYVVANSLCNKQNLTTLVM